MQIDKTSVNLPEQHGVVWRRAAILISLCALLALLATSDALHAALIQTLAAGEEVIMRHPLLGVVLFVVFAAVAAMLAFVSVAVVVPMAVFTWGEPLSMLLLWTGWILGGICSYGIGRGFGRAAVRWLTSEAALRRLEDSIQNTAPFGLVLLFQLALPSEIPGYILGLARYRFSKYLLALGLAELPYTVATVYVGAGFVERRSGVVLVLGFLLVVLSVGAFYILKKKLSRLTVRP